MRGERRARGGGGAIGARVREGVSYGGMGTVSSATAGRAPTTRRSSVRKCHTLHPGGLLAGACRRVW